MARLMPSEFMVLFECVDYFIVFVITSPRVNILASILHSFTPYLGEFGPNAYTLFFFPNAYALKVLDLSTS